MQQPHDHVDGHAIGEELVLIKVRQAIGHGKGPDLGSHQGVQGGGLPSGSGDLSVQGGGHGDLTEVQGQLDIVLDQGFAFDGIGIGVGATHQVDAGVIEVHLDGHFLLRHQQLAGVKQRRVGGEEHRVELAAHKGVHGFFQGFHVGLLRVGHDLVVVMGTVNGVIGHLGGRVKIVVPALRRQQGLTILSAVVQ